MAILGLLSLASLAPAGDKRWLRRATAIGACAASALDAYSSLRLNPWARQGLVREANPLFARRDGSVSPGRILSLKVAQCGASLMAERWLRNDKLSIGSNVAQIAAFSFVSASNFGHLSRLKNSPRSPSFVQPVAVPAATPRFDLAGPR